MRVVIKAGGSVFCPGDRPDEGFVNGLSKALLGLSVKHRLAVVVGGGMLARKMIGEASARTGSEEELHAVGVRASRMNASALISALGDRAFPEIPEDAAQASKGFKTGKIVVSGGFEPGQTTDAVAVRIAEAVGA